jgi:hypothetical protein
MSLLYSDDRIEITDAGVRIKGHLPWTTKLVPYREIRSVERRDIDATHVEFDLDTGHTRHPVITPDDPAAVAAILHDMVPDIAHH